MALYKPFIDPGANIDLYAGNERSYRELLPVYEELQKSGRHGTFYVSRLLKAITQIPTVKIKTNKLDGFAPLLICSYKDLHDVYVIGEERPFFMLESEHTTETKGLLQIVSLFICKDKRTVALRKTASKNVIQIDDSNIATKLIEYIQGVPVKHYDKIDKRSVGLIYMAWGEKAMQGVLRSIASLKRLGYSYPVAVIGDVSEPIKSTKEQEIRHIYWDGISPFDLSKDKRFRFRAGRVKPFLCDLSPFHYNLYLDADTQFVNPIHHGFELLHDYDMVVTEESLTLAELYNKKHAGWELNLEEKEITLIELGEGTEERYFINSGVMFFKKNKKVSKLFDDWHNQWMRFQEWDEQLALMRALDRNKSLKIESLPPAWNSPRYSDEIFIFHNYGRGSVRADV